jgi:hypothetical protein
MLAGGQVAPAQSTAEAVIVKIPAANIPSTVTLSAAGAAGSPGKNVRLPLSLSLAGATAPVSFQIELMFDATKLTFVSASAGPRLTGTGVTATAISANQVRVSTTGESAQAIASGVVAYATFTMATAFGTTSTPVTLANCMSAGTSGSPLSTGCTAGTIAVLTCAVTGDATVGVADVQAIANQALGVSPATYDLNGDGVVNLIDVKLVVNAALGKGCTF